MRTQKPHIAALSAKMEQVKRDIWHRQVWSGDGKMSKLTKYSAAVLAAGAMFAATQNAWAGPNDIVGSTTGTASGTVATPEETPDTTPKPVVLASWGGAAPVATEEAPATPKPIVLASWGGEAPVATPEATPAEETAKFELPSDEILIKRYNLKPEKYRNAPNKQAEINVLFEIFQKVEGSDAEKRALFARIGCIMGSCSDIERKQHDEVLPHEIKNRLEGTSYDNRMKSLIASEGVGYTH